MVARWLMLLVLGTVSIAADLKPALAEPDLEKRSRFALQNARSAC